MEKHGNRKEENMNSAMSNREKLQQRELFELRCKDREMRHRSGRRNGTGRAWLAQAAPSSQAWQRPREGRGLEHEHRVHLAGVLNLSGWLRRATERFLMGECLAHILF